jgi:autotransporter-associated beta strand protein
MTVASHFPQRVVCACAWEALRHSTYRAALAIIGLVVCLSGNARAVHEYFDINGTTTGSGVTNGGSYSWEGTNWNTTAAGTTTAPTLWPEGANFVRFSAGTDGTDKSYTITANSSHTIAGMVLQTGGGGNGTGKAVTVASANGSALTFFSNTGGQGLYVGGTSDQNLVITAPLGGDVVTPVVWQGALSGTAGTLSLYGNNTFSGGVNLNTTARLNFNGANSFGTGPIRWGFTGGTATSFALAAPAAGSPITIANTMFTKSASTLTMVDFAQPVTWNGAWTLATGNSTLDIQSGVDTTISGIISGANGTSALTKLSPGKLTLSGTNAFAGGTTVSGGTLEVSGGLATFGAGNVSASGANSLLAIDSGVADAISNSATLSLSNNATFHLGAGVNERVGFLSLDTALQPNATYGSSQSNAAIKLDMYFSGPGILTVGPSILPGDYDNDGIVNATDYVVWKKNIGQPSQTLPNDTTGVIVGQLQYDLWRSNFGNTSPVPGSGVAGVVSAVPEPSSVALLTLGLAVFTAITVARGANGISKDQRQR